jgi:hypothetical protein
LGFSYTFWQIKINLAKAKSKKQKTKEQKWQMAKAKTQDRQLVREHELGIRLNSVMLAFLVMGGSAW